MHELLDAPERLDAREAIANFFGKISRPSRIETAHDHRFQFDVALPAVD